jgi:N6-adenosine-specific RNA methylase IME4
MSRRALRRRVPNPEYLLGYVEDNESIDKIMKKFKLLEEYQEKNGKEDLTPEDCRTLIQSTPLGDIQQSFRPRYDLSDSPASSTSESEESKTAAYMDPITQSYKAINSTREGGQVILGNVQNLKLSSNFQAVLINSPEELPVRSKKKLKYLKDLVPTGLIFIWTHKKEIKEWVEVMEKFKFQYVENMVWVMVDEQRVQDAGGLESLTDFSSNFLSMKRAKPFSTSHKTLLLFRRVGGGKLELRHQRTCDVVFDYNSPKNYVYHLIETLLPEAGVKLELWADNTTREGWLHAVNSE